MERIDILVFADMEPVTILTDEPVTLIEEMITQYKKTEQYISGCWKTQEFFKLLRKRNVMFLPLPEKRIELNLYEY